jgi:hypothetical protein
MFKPKIMDMQNGHANGHRNGYRKEVLPATGVAGIKHNGRQQEKVKYFRLCKVLNVT